jgi:hypothetical protein
MPLTAGNSSPSSLSKIQRRVDRRGACVSRGLKWDGAPARTVSTKILDRWRGLATVRRMQVLRDDQDHGVGGLRCDRVHEAVEEVPGAFACAGDRCRGSGGCDVDAHRVHQITLVSGSPLPGPVRVVLVPGLRRSTRRQPLCACPPSPFEVDYLSVEHAEIYVGRSRHWVVVWLWFLS